MAPLEQEDSQEPKLAPGALLEPRPVPEEPEEAMRAREVPVARAGPRRTPEAGALEARVGLRRAREEEVPVVQPGPRAREGAAAPVESVATPVSFPEDCAMSAVGRVMRLSVNSSAKVMPILRL